MIFFMQYLRFVAGNIYIQEDRYTGSYLTTSAEFYNASVQFSCVGISYERNTTRKTIEVFVINEDGTNHN